MYGLLLESIVDCIHEEWGEGVWMQLVQEMGIDSVGFSVHNVYEETLVPFIAQHLSKILQITEDVIMYKFGGHFMTFVSSYGYDQITRVLGRRLCDFINGLDNLHDYISNLYKDIKPPSFYVETEDNTGITFHYNTPRKYVGYIHYVRGIVKAAAVMYFNLPDASVEVLKQEKVGEVTHAVLRLTFQNCSVDQQGSWMPALAKLRSVTPVIINSDVVFNSFPFSIIFSQNMEVLTCGAGVVKTFPTLIGKKITEFFVLTKPIGMPLSWAFMKNRPVNVLVELTSTVALWAEYEEYLRSQEILDPEHPPPPPKQRDNSVSLKLRGTAAFLKSWNAVIFMCTPVFEKMSVMKDVGLYISDLSFQDSLQMFLMAGPQQSAELKMAFDMEQAKTSKMEETLMELEREGQKTDALLYSMIPKEIAKRLKKRDHGHNIAEMFPDVTVLFSDVVGFTNICTRITPMEVVALLNTIYTVFDSLSERYAVFKVETIGDGYMAASGTPVRTKEHAQRICDMALEMQAGICHVKEPSGGNRIRIRIGIHSGGVVAGVVGRKMVRYCLFGDTVNTASRMESTGKGGEIHISKTVRDQLIGTDDYIVKDRGIMYFKGKGQMRTYWLIGKKGKFIAIPGSQFIDASSNATGMVSTNNHLVEGTATTSNSEPQKPNNDSNDILNFRETLEKILTIQNKNMKDYKEQEQNTAEKDSESQISRECSNVTLPCNSSSDEKYSAINILEEMVSSRAMIYSGASSRSTSTSMYRQPQRPMLEASGNCGGGGSGGESSFSQLSDNNNPGERASEGDNIDMQTNYEGSDLEMDGDGCKSKSGGNPFLRAKAIRDKGSKFCALL